MITGVRAALDHTSEPVVVYSDNEAVVRAVMGDDPFETYFSHALFPSSTDLMIGTLRALIDSSMNVPTNRLVSG